MIRIRIHIISLKFTHGQMLYIGQTKILNTDSLHTQSKLVTGLSSLKSWRQLKELLLRNKTLNGRLIYKNTRLIHNRLSLIHFLLQK
jgi:hypothetical protein